MTIQLFSHLSYADRNAYMDSARKVLACPAEPCDAQAPWLDAKDAVLRGWAFEDRVVGGAVVRQWFCPAHKPPDETPPLRTPTGSKVVTCAELSAEAAKLAFGGRRLIVLRLGENNGTQLAVVLRDETFGVYGIQVTGWRASSQCWTLPKIVTDKKILGAPSPRDPRVLVAAREWPPSFLQPRSKGRRR